jgi:hypothetical protein
MTGRMIPIPSNAYTANPIAVGHKVTLKATNPSVVKPP